MPHTGYAALVSELKVGATLDGSHFLVSTRPEDALRHDGLWPGGRPSRLFSLVTDDPVERQGERAKAANWHVSETLRVNDALEAVTKNLIDFEDELVEAQLLWRQALDRPKEDAAAVEAGLRRAMEARGLKYWQLERARSAAFLRQQPVDGPSMYTWSSHAANRAWEAWEREADEDPEYLEALKTAWQLWYRRDLWNSDEAFDGMDDVAPEVWDAWTAMLVFYTAEQGWLDLPANSFTAGIQDAYTNGLALAKPSKQGVLQWAMK